MAITDPRLAILVLDCLQQSGLPFAVIHGEESVAYGKAQSDVDIALEMNPRIALTKALPSLHDAGLHVVMIWPYDLGSASVFITTPAADDGVQLDLVHDTTGSGRYGFRADRIIRAADTGVRWRRAAPDHELLYLVRKRLEKRQHDRLKLLVDEARSRNEEQLRAAARDLFPAPHARLVQTAIYGDAPPPGWPIRLSRARSVPRRLVQRLRHPIGFWIAVNGPSAAEAATGIEARFARILPHAGSIATAGGLFEHLIVISKARLRPAVLTSTGRRPRGLTPDIEVKVAHPGDETSAMHRVVGQMEASLGL